MPRIIAMYGFDGAKDWRTWRMDNAVQRLLVLYMLAEASGDKCSGLPHGVANYRQ